MSTQAAEITEWKLPSEIPLESIALEVGRSRKCSSQLFPALEESVVKNPTASAGDTGDSGSIPELGKSPREGKGNTLQYFCLENPMDREAWRAIAHGVAESQT